MRGRRAGGGPEKRTGCDRIEPLLAAYHDGALSDADRLAVHRHLHGCERCTERLSAYGEVDRLLGDVSQPIAPPEVRHRLYARIASAKAETSGLSTGMAAPARGIRTRRRGSRWAAADPPYGPRSRAAFGRGGASEPSEAHGPRRISVVTGALAALTVAALLALVFARLPGHGLGGGTSTASRAARVVSRAVTSFAGLPRFEDWRAAYLGTDRQVHIVSADGSHSVTAPALPDDDLLTAAPAAQYANVATSPGGDEVAYVSGSGIVGQGTGTVPAGPVTVVDLRTGGAHRFDVTTTSCYWSPDGRRLVAPSADPSALTLYLLPAHGGSVALVTPTYNGLATPMHRLIGWIDSTHILGVFTPSPAPNQGPQGSASAASGTTSAAPLARLARSAASESAAPLARLARSAASEPLAQLFSGGLALVGLGIVDVTTGQLALLDNLPLDPETFLSPDGKLLFIPTSWWNDTAMVVDTATGQIRQLPNIGRAFAGKLQRVQTSLDAPDANWSIHAAWLPETSGAPYAMALSLAAGGPSTTGTQVSQPSGVWLLDLTNDSATRVTDRTYPLAWVPGASTLLTADPPGPDADGAYPAEGAGVGPTLYALAAPLVCGLQCDGTHEVPIAGPMLAYLGLVRTG